MVHICDCDEPFCVFSNSPEVCGSISHLADIIIHSKNPEYFLKTFDETNRINTAFQKDAMHPIGFYFKSMGKSEASGKDIADLEPLICELTKPLGFQVDFGPYKKADLLRFSMKPSTEKAIETIREAGPFETNPFLLKFVTIVNRHLFRSIVRLCAAKHYFENDMRIQWSKSRNGVVIEYEKLKSVIDQTFASSFIIPISDKEIQGIVHDYLKPVFQNDPLVKTKTFDLKIYFI